MAQQQRQQHKVTAQPAVAAVRISGTAMVPLQYGMMQNKFQRTLEGETPIHTADGDTSRAKRTLLFFVSFQAKKTTVYVSASREYVKQ